ncbi:phage tail tape measure protein [Burkholderia pseudomallei]|uniref:phage tail tape measure protein n=1 Tax=Burkholderia pseudomallei TaxID=28450 RepID=UPI001178A7FD|nr:phage tail tape measure protein [Burkholderia pseudomallei]
MTSIQKPKRALLAYCALADRLQKQDAGLMEALTPFFSPVCRDLAGKMFDAAQFSEEVALRYGLRIPRLAVLGLSEQLHREGLLEKVGGQGTKAVYRYALDQQISAEEVPAVTEAEIDKALADFVATCRKDDVLKSLDDEALHEGFLDRLLHTDSMRLLTRREANTTTKRTETTLTLKAAPPDSAEHRQLRLDYHVAQFLLDLRQMEPERFNRVSDIAFANMAAEALACFSEPVADASAPLTDFSVYLDSPLLLDILGINSEYEEYGKELLEMIKAAKATPKVFDDAIAEAETVIAARLTVAMSGNGQSAGPWGAASTHVLSALANQVGANAEKRGIEAKANPTLDLTRRSKDTVGTIQDKMNRQMASWRNDEARDHDQRSVWSMLRIRNVTIPRTKIRDGQAIFVARNTRLVRIANDAWKTWLHDGVHHSRDTAERWAPIAMSDKQLAGYLWLRNSGVGNGTMSRARLLAHCSAAIRPRPDVKARAYNLVLELEGKDAAEAVAALMEDREGERALIRATRADPEDVTPERLPYIIDQVKLGAGEYAAERAREEGRLAAEAKQAEHDAEVTRLRQAASEEAQKAGAQSDGLAQELAQQTLQRVQAEQLLQTERRERAAEKRQKQLVDEAKFSRAFDISARVFRRLRWELVCLYAVALFYILMWNPTWVQAICVVGLTVVGFWFIPSILERPLYSYVISIMRRELKRREVGDMLHPTEKPDFHNRSWATARFAAMASASQSAASPTSQSTDTTSKDATLPESS